MKNSPITLSLSTDPSTLCLPAASSEVEVKDQQIRTELTETQHQHVPAGRMPEQQGRTHAYNNNTLK